MNSYDAPKCTREACPAKILHFGKDSAVWICHTCHIRLQTRDEELTVRLAIKLVKQNDDGSGS